MKFRITVLVVGAYMSILEGLLYIIFHCSGQIFQHYSGLFNYYTDSK